MSTSISKSRPLLMPAYRRLFKEISNQEKYIVRTVYEHYVKYQGLPDPERVTIVLRIDVDAGFHLSMPLAEYLKEYSLTASHYFLTHPHRYYNLWNSDIPRKIQDLGQEVGLHTDHYYEALTEGGDGILKLKSDVYQLNSMLKEPIKGFVHHGHPAIDALGVKNWDLTKNIPPEELEVEYHDGLTSKYIQEGINTWRPKCDARISDFMGLSNSWGWNYLPWYPALYVKLKARRGKVFHIALHTQNAFAYWENWTMEYGEKPLVKETVITFWKKRIIIFYKVLIVPVWRKPVLVMLRFFRIEERIRRWLKRF